MSNVISSYVVRSGGSVDVEASVAKFRAALASHVAESETEQSVIADAVNAVFDSNRGTVIPMPALTGLALQNMNAQPENFRTLAERVQGYIRESAKGDNSALVITKGKGGGVSRRADRASK